MYSIFKQWVNAEKILRRRIKGTIFYPFPPANYLQWIHCWRELKTLSTDKFNTILDAGYGPGHYTKELARIYPDLTVIGYDSSSWFPTDHSLPNLHFRERDLKNLTDINKFDLILCIEVLEHIPGNRKVISNLYRSLKPGGYLLVHMPHERPIKWILPKAWFSRYQDWAKREHIGEQYDLCEAQRIMREEGFQIYKAQWTFGTPGQILMEMDELMRRYPRMVKILRMLSIPVYKPLAHLALRMSHSHGSILIIGQKS